MVQELIAFAAGLERPTYGAERFHMQISVFGLGYVGAVTAGCLANEGHTVIGVDVQAAKVDLANAGKSPVIEEQLDELIRSAVERGNLRATIDAWDAVLQTDLSLVCVGTPSRRNGDLDTGYVQRVCEEIGSALKQKEGFHVVAIRSTILPGTMAEIVVPALEAASGKTAGRDLGVCTNPEFMREGSAVADFYHPPRTVIGESDRRAGDLLAELYAGIDAPLVRTDIEIAEMIKYADNAWHALKIGFANEIGNICKAIGIDSHRVMEIFRLDTKLNLSGTYLTPGFAFGGSCLPKDLRALTYKARRLDVETPILSSVLAGNRLQVERGIRMITDKGRKKVGVLGFSFKAGTDDLRESPVVEVIEHLIGKGYDVRVFDRNVKLASLVGANRDYILNHIPHISRLMADDIDEVLGHAEIIVIGNNDPGFRSVPQRLRPGQLLVDFVRITDRESSGDGYDGICW
jgi:GDP-mannose 6-dehydrogenase